MNYDNWKLMGEDEERTDTLTCEHCSNEFYEHLSNAESDGRFCDHECETEFNND